MHQTLLRKLIYRSKAGIPKVKQLKKFKQGEDLKAATKFTERNIGKYYKTVVGQYFLKNHLINLT